MRALQVRLNRGSAPCTARRHAAAAWARHAIGPAGPLLLVAVFAALFFFPTFITSSPTGGGSAEIGYQIVFTRELTTRLLLFLAAGGLTAGVLYLNLRTAQRGLVPYPVVLRVGQSAALGRIGLLQSKKKVHS